MSHRAYMQGSFRAPATATIRVRDVLGAANSDWVVTAGDTWASADALLAAWTAQLVSDFGAGWSVAAVPDDDLHWQTVTVTTSGGTFNLTWSFAGDGTAIRNWLGEAGDLAGEASGYQFGSRMAVSFVARYGGRLVASSRGRERGHLVTMDGTPWRDSYPQTDDADDVTGEVSLWFGRSDGLMAGHQQWETYWGSLWAYPGGGEPLSVVVADELGNVVRWACRLADDVVTLRPEQVDGADSREMWVVRFSVDVDSEAAS